ncbi:MAG: glycosyltransferase family 2 protein [Candidatus Methylacidiphilales bacterium]
MSENNKYPLVSIICLCWNHEEYINQCFSSIFEQTYKNIEIIFIDNNSTDNSYQIGLSLLQKSAISYKTIKRNDNFSVSNNLNKALNECSGTYVLCISTDDWLTNDSIELKVNFLENNLDYAMVYTNGYLYFQNNDLIKDYIIENPFSGNVFKELLKSNFIFDIGVLTRKQVMVEVGKYDENIGIEDWYMWLKIAEKNKVGFLDKKLAFYRKHNTNSSLNLKKMKDNELKILNQYLNYKEAQVGIKKIKKRYIQQLFFQQLNKLALYRYLKNNIKKLL